MLSKFIVLIIFLVWIGISILSAFRIIRIKYRNKKWIKTTATVISSKEKKVIIRSGALLFNEIAIVYLKTINKTVTVECKSVNYKKSLLEVNDIIPIVYNPLDENDIQVICNFREHVIAYIVIYFDIVGLIIFFMIKVGPLFF